MMTASEREDLCKGFLAALDRVSLKTAMEQCKKAFEAGPQPNVSVSINLVGE